MHSAYMQRLVQPNDYVVSCLGDRERVIAALLADTDLRCHYLSFDGMRAAVQGGHNLRMHLACPFPAPGVRDEPALQHSGQGGAGGWDSAAWSSLADSGSASNVRRARCWTLPALRCPAAVPAPQVNRNGTGLKTMSQLNSAISNEEPDIISNRWGGHGSAAMAGRAGSACIALWHNAMP